MTELERTLVALGRALDVPAEPDVAPAVLARLEPRESQRTRRRRWAVAVALAALALLAAVLAVPEARSALFRVLHIGAARIELVDELPPVPAEPDLELALGERISLAEARRGAELDLRELEEPPDRVYVDFRGTVWFLYGRPDEVRLLVAQTPRLRVDDRLLLWKVAGPGTTVEPVLVGDARGAYIGGDTHFLVFLDEQGNPVEESARLARDVLVWDDDGAMLRLEGDFSKERALELAASLR
jgi:hypothetical protein